MTERQFLQELEIALNRLPAEERADILQDIREYFSNGRADGKSDSDIAAELGDPASIASELIDSYDFSSPENAAAAIGLVKDEFDRVDIQIDNGQLLLTPSPDGQLHVDIADKTYKQQLSVNIVDRTLVITLTEEVKLWGIFSITSSMNTPTLKVQLPDKLYEKIQIASDHGSITGKKIAAAAFDVETDNGSIEFSQIGAGDFSVTSDNGDIRLTSIQSKTLEAETDNGEIILSDIQSSEVEATTANGAITLEDIEADIQAQTDNGRIRLSAADINRSIKLETDNGSILLETRKQPENAVIRADVDWGSVSVFGSKNRKTVFGNGQHPVVLQSDNGSITVKLID